MTKEVLAGYYLIRAADLDEALKHAARVPLARYGSVEVRPVADPAPHRSEASDWPIGEPAGAESTRPSGGQPRTA